MLNQPFTEIIIKQKTTHPIFIGNNIIRSIPEFLLEEDAGHRVVIITQSNLIKDYVLHLEQKCEDNGFKTHIIDIAQGEAYKSWTTVEKILDNLLSLKIDRKDTIIALGGGVIGDLAGFVASIYMRGIRLIQVPTTLLAQVDAAIGGKTAVNHKRGKNLIGSFYQANAIVIDTKTLSTLPRREILSGLAEVIKYGIIMNPTLFRFLEENHDIFSSLKLSKLNAKEWEYIIQISAADKVSVVTEDEKESGKRAILNFGHTVAHGIEAATSYNAYTHGEAVAIGMLVESKIALEAGILSQKHFNKIERLIKLFNFPLEIKGAKTKEILEKMKADKKNTDQRYTFVLPTEIGNTIITDTIDINIIENAITEFLK